mmetsp:Transcript_27772/g.70118  ORF Transcript_27772/g.70118 Transcript_27772/m.70118 type:complete len:97 (-) Transcript_27772:402-692(-)
MAPRKEMFFQRRFYCQDCLDASYMSVSFLDPPKKRVFWNDACNGIPRYKPPEVATPNMAKIALEDRGKGPLICYGCETKSKTIVGKLMQPREKLTS